MAGQREFEFKFRRAQRHLDDLNVEIHKWLGKNFESITYEHDANRANHFSAYALINPFPIDIPLLVGDALQNLRGSLDHLVYTLAERHTGAPLPDDVAKDSEFPIFRVINSSEIARKTRGIDPCAQTVIESLQPYNSPNPLQHPLWILHDLSNFDKHRLLLSGALANMAGVIRNPGWRNIIGYNIEVHSGYLEGKAKIATFNVGTFDTSNIMDMKYVPLIEVVFHCGCITDGKSVQGVLKDILKYIGGRVFVDLDKFL